MAGDEEQAEIVTKWWGDWFATDFSWDGLQHHRIAGDGGPDGQVTLQDYWRQSPDNSGDVRTDEELEASGELERGPDDRLWHVAHVPLHWANGAPTWKSTGPHRGWTRLERIIRRRIEVATETEIDESFYENGIEGEDGRAQLQGCVLRRIPWLRAASERTHVLADRAAFLGAVYSHRYVIGRGASFKKCLFVGRVLFNGTEFDNVNFNEGVFRKRMHVVQSRFKGDASFESALFGEVSFSGSKFFRAANFRESEFAGAASFSRSEFLGDTTFSSVRFLRAATFSGVGFGGIASFNRAIFQGSADFSGAPTNDETPGQASTVTLTYNERTVDDGVHRSLDGQILPPTTEGALKRRSFRKVDFTDAHFADVADFSNRNFLATAGFSGVRFCAVAKFHDSKLHQDTSFASATFAIAQPRAVLDLKATPELSLGERPPNLAECNAHYEEYERAFRTLKLAMEGQRARREEARFYRRELEARRRRPSVAPANGGQKEVTRIEKVVSYAYEAASDFGESLSRPLAWLLALWLVTAAAYAAMAGELQFNCWIFDRNCEISPAVSLAGERTWLPFLAQGTSIAEWGKASATSAGMGASLLGIVHRVLATILIFLFALAVRRKFQIS